MGFGGGGSAQLTSHTHDPAIPLDGGALAANATSFGLTAGSVLYSDGVNIEELVKPAVPAGEVLKFESGAAAPSWGNITQEVTYEQLTDDYPFNVFGGDWYSIALLLDAKASSITGSEDCTNVQFGFYANAHTDGTIYCCRWADLATYSGEATAADLYAAADHVYWSTPVNGNGAGMSAHAVTPSDGLAVGCVIGYVVVGAGIADGATGAFWQNEDDDWSPYRSSALSTATYSSTPEFTITVNKAL